MGMKPRRVTRTMHLLEQTHDIVGTKAWLGHRNIENTMLRNFRGTRDVASFHEV
jgi:hypothetical protein